MKKKIKISNEEIKELLGAPQFDFPKYSTQIINLANRNARGTRPNVVGQMSELIQEFPGYTIQEWEKWYLTNYPDAIKEATDRIMAMIENFRDVIMRIDRDLVEKWVIDLVIVKTFIGLRFQETVLGKLSSIFDLPFRLANPEEESKGIDGYLGEVPISIKPDTYKIKQNLSEEIEVAIVYYQKVKDGITLDISMLPEKFLSDFK